MKIEISYDTETEKVFMKIDEEDKQEIDYSHLLNITNKVLDENIDLDVNISGFDNAPDIGANYKKMFDDISKLKDDKEIVELKEKLNKDNKTEE